MVSTINLSIHMYGLSADTIGHLLLLTTSLLKLVHERDMMNGEHNMINGEHAHVHTHKHTQTHSRAATIQLCGMSWKIISRYMTYVMTWNVIHVTLPKMKGDLILENQPNCHIWYFEKYQFKILKPLWLIIVTLDTLYNCNSPLARVL